MENARPRIVVVEDDDDVRVFLEDLFESGGFDVRSAQDPESAYATIASFGPAVLVLDVMLPRQSGFDVYRTLRRCHEPVPAIFVTAKPTEAPRNQAHELGALAFFRKPFPADQLLACARRAARPDVPARRAA